MNIGQTARLIGASAGVIRYWGPIGLLAKARGAAGSRRVVSQLLRLIRRGCDAGFAIEQTLILLQLWRACSNADAGTIARGQAVALKRRITDMQAMVRVLEHLASTFKGDVRGGSPLFGDTAEGKTATVPTGHRRLPLGALRFGAEKPALAPWRAPTVRRT